jgi:hypothetical protein
MIGEKFSNKIIVNNKMTSKIKFYTNPPEIGERIEKLKLERERHEYELYQFIYNYEINHRILLLNKNIDRLVNEIKKMKKPLPEKKKILKSRMDEIQLKEYINNYTKHYKINVSNRSINFFINKIKNSPIKINQKKKYLIDIIINTHSPPLHAQNIKKRTNKNRKITRQKGNATKSRLSK